MRILDLFCCSGGAGVGYHRQGFKVVGVDIQDRPRYPFEFLQDDALEVLRDQTFMAGFDAIHASPPCQHGAAITKGTNQHLQGKYPDLYAEVAELMYASGLPGVIETTYARPDWVLCGEMFGLGVIRHRRIELVNWTAPAPVHVKHRGYVRGWRHGVYRDGPYIAAYGKGGGKGTVEEMQEAMGITWTNVHEELTEAIPPAYTECIGKSLKNHLLGG